MGLLGASLFLDSFSILIAVTSAESICSWLINHLETNLIAVLDTCILALSNLSKALKCKSQFVCIILRYILSGFLLSLCFFLLILQLLYMHHREILHFFGAAFWDVKLDNEGPSTTVIQLRWAPQAKELRIPGKGNWEFLYFGGRIFSFTNKKSVYI